MPSLVALWLRVMPGFFLRWCSVSWWLCFSPVEHLFDCECASDNSSLLELPFAEFEVSSYFTRVDTFQPPSYGRNPQIQQQPMLQHSSISLDI